MVNPLETLFKSLVNLGEHDFIVLHLRDLIILTEQDIDRMASLLEIIA